MGVLGGELLDAEGEVEQDEVTVQPKQISSLASPPAQRLLQDVHLIPPWIEGGLVLWVRAGPNDAKVVPVCLCVDGVHGERVGGIWNDVVCSKGDDDSVSGHGNCGCRVEHAVEQCCRVVEVAAANSGIERGPPVSLLAEAVLHVPRQHYGQEP
ncbi:hypothetical protein B484DRAFT_457996 [Ochromonadaceae sp. CCMP2298]|nr:hypothetical protein B484DRAFT_457996 [Ochromonadaceae sp. CCMP2298]